MSTPAAEAYRKSQQPYPSPTHTELGLRELDHSHRCDSCGAQAWVRTESRYSTLELTWCSHHFREIEPHFSAATHVITDERPHLYAAVKAQANRKEIH